MLRDLLPKHDAPNSSPVHRIVYKVVIMTYKCLLTWRLRISHGTVIGMRLLVSLDRRYVSAETGLEIPSTRRTFGYRSLAVPCQRVWNSLPVALRDSSLTLSAFGRKLTRSVNSAARVIYRTRCDLLIDKSK